MFKQVHRRRSGTGIILLLIALLVAPSNQATYSAQQLARLSFQPQPAATTLPLQFEPNLGQFDPTVRYLARGQGYTLFLTDQGAVQVLTKQEGDNLHHQPPDPTHLPTVSTTTQATLRYQLQAANLTPFLQAEGKLPGVSNYFIGNDPARWHTNVPTYARVVYQDAYPGIDLAYYAGSSGGLEYDLIVHPGADPGVVRLKVAGAENTSLVGNDLMFATAVGQVRQHAPHVYQQTAKGKQEVTGSYRLDVDGVISFQTGSYDRSLALVIDPTVDYATFFGGTLNDFGSVSLGPDGTMYLAGTTYSTDFPVSNAYQPTYAGNTDAFVAKLSPDGSTLLFATYLGGRYGEGLGPVILDSAGNLLLTGYSGSDDYPTTAGALQPRLAGYLDAVITKLAAGGDHLIFSTYFGGPRDDFATQAALDSTGNIYLSGETFSVNFPTRNAYQPAFGSTDNSYADGFFSELNADGSTLLYSSFLGGASGDMIARLVLAHGSIYLAGYTSSTNFPVSPGAYQPTMHGIFDCFISRFDPSSNQLLYSTYLGGSGQDWPGELVVDEAGNAYFAGRSDSLDFPTTASSFQQEPPGGLWNGFVTKLNPTGTDLVYSTYLGGSDSDNGAGLWLDGAGDVYLSGISSSADFPLVNPIQSNLAGSYDITISELNPTGTALLFSTFLGGSREESVGSPISDGRGHLYLAGFTYSADFPLHNPLQAHLAGGEDLLLVRLSLDQPNLTATPSPQQTNSPIATRTPSPPTPTATASPLPPTSTATNTPCGLDFSDVGNSIFRTDILYLACRGAVSGFVNGDGSYRFEPSSYTTRGQFSKMTVLGLGLAMRVPLTPTFSDVPADSTFYRYVESASAAAAINGLNASQCARMGAVSPCYGPNLNISRAELAVIVHRARHYPTVLTTLTFSDVTSSFAFEEIETLAWYHVVGGAPCSLPPTGLCYRPNDLSRRGELAKIMRRGIETPP